MSVKEMMRTIEPEGNDSPETSRERSCSTGIDRRKVALKKRYTAKRCILPQLRSRSCANGSERNQEKDKTSKKTAEAKRQVVRQKLNLSAILSLHPRVTADRIGSRYRRAPDKKPAYLPAEENRH